LQDAISNGISQPLIQRVETRLSELSSSADVVICTCSTLGSIAAEQGLQNVFRIDAPMMAAAVRHTPVLLVMCLQSTMQPSSQLLEEAFVAAGHEQSYRSLLCADAWKHFETHSDALFAQAIASAVQDEISRNGSPGAIVLAQASMRVAKPHLTHLNVPVFTSPELAVQHALTFRDPLP